MKKLLVLLVVLSLIVCPALGAKIHVGNIGKAFERVYDLSEKGKLPLDAVRALMMHQIRANYTHKGNMSCAMSFKGVLNNVYITIYGNGTELSHYNTTELSASNGTTITLNFKYYPRNVTLTFKGYEWWNSQYQHIINGTGSVIAQINDTDGSFSVADDYTTNNPIWDSIGANLTVNTSAGWLEHSDDTVAETVSVIYNITVDDGYLTSLTWNNVSIYVAPNSTAGSGQDDLNIYYSTDGGSTWTTLFDGDDGSTSSGTQWTGDISLPIDGNKSVLIKIEFVSDGADDKAGQADVYIDAINITGTVSKLPTRNPKIDVNNDGAWDVEYSGSLTNGTASTSFSLGDLNLTNTMKVYAEGSGKVFLNFTWYDEGRLHVIKILCGGAEVNVSKFVASGENYSISLPNITDVIPPVDIEIVVDNEHTLCNCYNYSVTLETYPFMLLSNTVVSVSPSDGVSVEHYTSVSKPIPVFVKPRNASCYIGVNVYNPNASTADVYLNITIESAHGNAVDFFLTDVPADSLDVYIDGNYYTTLNVTDGVCNFTMTNFSTHNVEFVIGGALAIAPQEISWQWVAGVLILAVLIFVLLYLLVATLRGK